MKKILVTGAGGFIGGHLVAYLTANNFQVRAVDVKPLSNWYRMSNTAENIQLDLSMIENCRLAVRGTDEIYNLAADMGGMGFIETHKARCMLSVLVNTHMLMAAREEGTKKFFYSSSACVYNGEKQNSINASGLKESDAYPAMPEDGYGWEKLFSERMCRHFHEDFGLQTRVARFHNVYGPNGTFDGGREKAPAAICRKVVLAKLTGKNEIEIWGDGEQRRSFMYIDDCITGIMKISEGSNSEPVNLGSEELVSINQLVSMIEQIAGVRLQKTYLLTAPQGVRGRNSDNSNLREIYNWEPRVSLMDGLEKTYTWIYNEITSGKNSL